MIKAFVIDRKTVGVTLAGLAFFAGVVIWNGEKDAASLNAAAPAQSTQVRTIQMVTGEFSSKLANGKEIEAYRWDPGTIYIHKGEQIRLVIRGINGDSHPFVIEGMNIKGEVKKGQDTEVTFKAEKEGIYRIVCLTHSDAAHNGPMVGYIVVD